MHKTTAALTLIAAISPLATGATSAYAEEPGEARSPEPEGEVEQFLSEEPPLIELRKRPKVWFGWQILIADLASTGVAISAAVLGSPELGIVAGGTYLGAGPIVHLAHGRAKMGLLSFGIRTVGPALSTAAMLALLSDSGSSSAGAGALVVALAGASVIPIIAASVIDIAVLARKPTEITPPDDDESYVSIAPTFAAAPGGTFAFGFGGTF